MNRWVEKIQGYDFSIEYSKGEDLAAPDALSRLYENKTEETEQEAKEAKEAQEKQRLKQERGDRIRESRAKVHMTEREGKKWWRHDNGREVEVPEVEDRIALIAKIHEQLMHRGSKAVYYELRKAYYWPGMQKEVELQLKECETCKINNRKCAGGSEFVVTTRRGEKVAIDLIDVREECKYILVGIDYFTRVVSACVMPNKSSGSVIEVLKEWIKEGDSPEEIITDNGKEFVSEEFRKFCRGEKIEHRKVSVESHRSNGRVERVIGTIREGLVKNKQGTLEGRLRKIVSAYNRTYHTAIDCTPMEAIKNINGNALAGNSAVSR